MKKKVSKKELIPFPKDYVTKTELNDVSHNIRKDFHETINDLENIFDNRINNLESELMRRMGALHEETQHQIKILAESISMMAESMDRKTEEFAAKFGNHEMRITTLELKGI